MPDDNTISRLYQQSREETMDTRDLDEKILAAANAELEANRKPAAPVVNYSGWRRWSTPVAAAACLLLATSVGFNVVLYQQSQLSPESEAELFSDLAIMESAPAPQNAPQVAQEYRKKEALTSPQATAKLREQRFPQQASGEMYESAEVIEEVVVTAHRVEIDSALEQQINAVIELLENGELKQAEQQLALLLDSDSDKKN